MAHGKWKLYVQPKTKGTGEKLGVPHRGGNSIPSEKDKYEWLSIAVKTAGVLRHGEGVQCHVSGFQ